MAWILEIMTLMPEFFLLCGAPELPRVRRPRFLTVRTGKHIVLVEA